MKLQDWLDLNKISTYQLAEKLGVAQSNVFAWCTGTIPRRDAMQQIEKETKGAVTPVDFYR